MNPYQSPAVVDPIPAPGRELLDGFWQGYGWLCDWTATITIVLLLWPLILICWSGSYFEGHIYEYCYRHGLHKRFGIGSFLIAVFFVVDWLALGLLLCTLWLWLLVEFGVRLAPQLEHWYDLLRGHV